jgi:peptide/nickel transport system substrate-binding protein
MQMRYRLPLLCIVISGLFLACAAPPPSSNRSSQGPEARTTGKRGGKLTYRVTAPPKTLNYLMAADEATIMAAFYPLTSRLVDFDHSTQKFIPALAESVQTQPDGRTVRIKLRPGLKFSDGNDLTADDVVFSFAAVYDEKTQSPAFKSAMMVGGKPIEVQKVGDLELQLTFPQPVPSADNYLVNLGILPSHVMEADLKSRGLSEVWKIDAPPQSIVTSGPFTVQSAVPGERIEFVRNPHYWKKDQAGTQLPYLEAFTIEVVADANNGFSRLTQGTIDFADRIRPGDFVELSKGQTDVRAYDAGPGLGIDHMWFNLNAARPDGTPLNNEVKRRWFSDKRFRQAVAAAVDRETIAAVTLQGLASPLYGIVSPANKQWIKPDLAKIEYSLDRAGQLLADAGFKKTGPADAPVLTDAQGTPVEFTLIVPAENEPRKLMAAAIQQDLAKLGVRMQVVPIEFAAVTDRWTKTYDYDAVLLGLSQTDTEPSSYQNFLLSSSPTHQWQPKQSTPATEWESRIDKLFAEQAAELDRDKRFRIFAEIQQIFRDEMPVIPIAARHVVAAANKKVGNFSPSSILPYSLWNVEEIFVKP